MIVLMRVGRGLGNVSGTFNCRFEAIGNKVYFDMIKLLLPFCVFEFEVIVLLVIVYGQWWGIVLIIIVVMVVELTGNRFTV